MKNQLDPNHLEAWRLFLTAHAQIINQIDKQLELAGQIPLNWYDVLIEVYEAPERQLRMSDIAERVLLTRSGLTRLVDRLEKAGYIIREIDPEDRRGFYARITPEGIDAMRGAWQVYSEAIQRTFASYIDDEQARLFIGIFSVMIQNLTMDDQ